MFRKNRKEYPKHFLSRKTEVRESEIHGIGLFAVEAIEAHELIEGCPVVIFHVDTKQYLEDFFSQRHVLMDYPFYWSPGLLAFALGYGGLYNHSTYSPNATWKVNREFDSLDFYSRHAIEPGEEILIRYLSIEKCNDGNLWFSDPTVPAIPLRAED